MVANVRMAFATLDDTPFLVFDEAARSQGHPMINLHMIAEAASLSDDYARSVINEEMCPDICPRMYVNARPAMHPLGHHARNNRGPAQVQPMCDPLNGDGLDERKGQYDLFMKQRRRIA